MSPPKLLRRVLPARPLNDDEALALRQLYKDGLQKEWGCWKREERRVLGEYMAAQGEIWAKAEDKERHSKRVEGFAGVLPSVEELGSFMECLSGMTLKIAVENTFFFCHAEAFQTQTQLFSDVPSVALRSAGRQLAMLWHGIGIPAFYRLLMYLYTRDYPDTIPGDDLHFRTVEDTPLEMHLRIYQLAVHVQHAPLQALAAERLGITLSLHLKSLTTINPPPNDISSFISLAHQIYASTPDDRRQPLRLVLERCVMENFQVLRKSKKFRRFAEECEEMAFVVVRATLRAGLQKLAWEMERGNEEAKKRIRKRLRGCGFREFEEFEEQRKKK